MSAPNLIPEVARLSAAVMDDICDPEHASVMRELQSHLAKMRSEGPLVVCSGICWNLTEAALAIGATAERALAPRRALAGIFTALGYDSCHPIQLPRGTKVTDRWGTQFKVNTCTGSDLYDWLPRTKFWDRNHPYGAARWALLDEVLAYLKDRGYGA